VDIFWYIVEVVIQLGWLYFCGFIGVLFCWIVTSFITQKEGEPNIRMPKGNSKEVIWASIGMAFLIILVLPEFIWVVKLF